MLSATAFANWGVADSIGGVRSLIDNGKSSQAHESLPNINSQVSDDAKNHGVPDGFWSRTDSAGNTKPLTKPLFNSLAGFALEMGDRLLINGEEVIFKGWVDQSLTAIEVKAIADVQAPIKQIRAKDIKSLARSLSPDPTPQPPTAKTPASEELHDTASQAPQQVSSNVDPEPETIHPDHQEVTNTDQTNTGEVETTASEEQTEITKEPEYKEPEYNAWEVWMYLERQRLKTLKLLNTFQAEWEANRFVREAERSAPPTLRVHYEIRPIWLDESTLNSGDQHDQDADRADASQDDSVESYADAIDVEIIS